MPLNPRRGAGAFILASALLSAPLYAVAVLFRRRPAVIRMLRGIEPPLDLTADPFRYRIHRDGSVSVEPPRRTWSTSRPVHRRRSLR